MFPNAPTFQDRLAAMARTFRYRSAAMVMLAFLFLEKDAPRHRIFGVAMLVWIVFEIGVKFYVDRKQGKSAPSTDAE